MAYGAGIGSSTGYGVAFKQYFGSLGYQVNAFPGIAREGAMISVGFTPMYRFVEQEKSAWFIYQGNHMLTMTNYTDGINIWINGLGLGYEFDNPFTSYKGSYNDLRFNIMIGLARYAQGNASLYHISGEVAVLYEIR